MLLCVICVVDPVSPKSRLPTRSSSLLGPRPRSFDTSTTPSTLSESSPSLFFGLGESSFDWILRSQTSSSSNLHLSPATQVHDLLPALPSRSRSRGVPLPARPPSPRSTADRRPVHRKGSSSCPARVVGQGPVRPALARQVDPVVGSRRLLPRWTRPHLACR